MNTPRDPSAFPVSSNANQRGVSQRDWFAAMALQGLVAKGLEVSGDRVLSERDKCCIMADRAYRLADAMMLYSEKNAIAPEPAAAN